ncbi:MAG: glycosyltransferase family 2 protein [Flavobacteriaceae bacterium]|nr:glycosyltransferase family 2 protein [Flavobacteriaceae bacterium]
MPDTLLQWVFWLSLCCVFYTYFGYGLLIGFFVFVGKFFKTIGGSKRTSVCSLQSPISPPLSVTLVIPCFNEANILEKKIANSLTIDYPNLHIIFITDGSSDDSEKLLEKYHQVKVLHQTDRQGKAMAENRAMQFVETEITVFCDANTLLNKEAIQNLVKHFANPKVGAVSGEKRVLRSNTGAGATEGIYWKYESLLKKLDCAFHTVVGAAGELFAIRTALFTPMPHDTINDDLTQSLQVNLKGYTVAYASDAFATEIPSSDLNEEKKRKVRMVAGAWQSMARQPRVFNVFQYPLLTFQFVSHRALRWTLCPLSIVLLIPTGLLLCHRQDIYTLLFYLQLVFYALTFAGFLAEKMNIRLKFFFIPYYFSFMNYTAILGFFRYLKGGQSAIWEKAKR